MESVVDLRSDKASNVGVVGVKANNLHQLAKAGFAVPEGQVVSTATFSSGTLADSVVDELWQRVSLWGCSLAVRSSSVLEDLAGASFAGRYSTVLDVTGKESLKDSILEVWASANPRQDDDACAFGTKAAPMAVLVMPLLKVQASGVAFSRNPLTGAQETLISAVPSIGEDLVSGARPAEEWCVRPDGSVERVSAPCKALSEAQVHLVASLANKVGAHFQGMPVDIEWAFEADKLWLLQARPMTALPEVVDWSLKSNHQWLRHFRIGEWLDKAMTPLFETLILPPMEKAMFDAMYDHLAWRVREPFHQKLHGWYFGNPFGSSTLLDMLPPLWYHFSEMWALIRIREDPERAHRLLVAPAEKRWRATLLPTYQERVKRGWEELPTLTEPSQLVVLCDELTAFAGQYLYSIAHVAGFAWKLELVLGTNVREWCGISEYQALLAGLTKPIPFPGHTVSSLDPIVPTFGELRMDWNPPSDARFEELVQRRQALEQQCFKAVAPGKLELFRSRLQLAQHFARVREEQVRDLTLAWPLIRAAVLQLGRILAERSVISDPSAVFFLRRDELLRLKAITATEILARRNLRDKQSRLQPPLSVGKPDPRLENLLSMGEELRVQVEGGSAGAVVIGQPASSGRAVGRVRILQGPEDFSSFQAGEIIVAKGTSPAWTPLFARAGAIVTDGGSLAAHASLVAREYGIPSVVATVNATTALVEGEIVTVDGSLGAIFRGMIRGAPPVPIRPKASFFPLIVKVAITVAVISVLAKL